MQVLCCALMCSDVLCPPLHLSSQVLALDEQLDLELGPAATAWCFANLLLTGEAFYNSAAGTETETGKPADRTPSSASPTVNSQSVEFMLQSIREQDVPAVEKFLFCNFGSRFLLPVMVRANGISAGDKQRAKETIRSLFRRMDALLRSNRSSSNGTSSSFLLGTQQMTAADITFASLAAPILLPPQMEKLLPSFSAMEGVVGTGSGPSGTRPLEFAGVGGASVPSHGQVSRQEAVGCVDQADFARELRNKHISAQLCLRLYEHYRWPASPSASSSSPYSQETRGEYGQVIISAAAAASSPPPQATAAAVVQPKTTQQRARMSSASSWLGRLVPQKAARDPNSCRPER